MLDNWISAPQFLMAGIAFTLITVALLWLLIGEYRKFNLRYSHVPVSVENVDKSVKWLVWLGVIVCIGAVLRLFELDAKTLTHPEAYTPNLDFPPDISTPPSRHGFIETLRWHFFDEPHPVGYYMGMWAWTKVFGTSITSIRMTSVLMGVGSIILIYYVASLFYNRRVGLVSAILLAANGFHIYWSQVGRMYVPGCFFGLLSILLLYKILHSKRPNPGLEIAYVITIVSGVSTQIFFWPFVGMQIIWVLLNYSARKSISPRVIYIQTISLILSSPMWSHIVYMTRQHHADTPTIDFLVNFFSFGFVLRPENFSDVQGVPYVVILFVLLLSLVLFVKGILKETEAKLQVSDDFSVPRFIPLIMLALGIAIFMYSISYAVPRRVEALRVVSLLPLLLIFFPVIAAKLGPVLNRHLVGKLVFLGKYLLPSPIPMLAVVPVLTLFFVSLWISVIAPRAFLIFVPYLLIIISAGIVSLGHKRIYAIVIGALVVAISLNSIVSYIKKPHGTKNYKALASVINKKSYDNDLYFVKKHDWAVTPIFYYLNPDRAVGMDYRAAIKRNPGARVWVIHYWDEEALKKMLSSLKAEGYQLVEELSMHEARVLLYEPPGQK